MTDTVRFASETPALQARRDVMFNSPYSWKIASCTSLLFLSVAATLFTEASKSEDGTFPYNSFVIPCAVEVVKLSASTSLLIFSRVKGDVDAISFRTCRFASFALPAFCYFISNNCMFYIIKELGPTTFQITNNLKILATAILMRMFLSRTLTWIRWKALILLVLGSAVTQLQTGNCEEVKQSTLGFALVFLNSLASGAGGVVSEKLLKVGNGTVAESIHWQNMQLYFFGLIFGFASLSTKTSSSFFEGLNAWAYATIISLALAGLLVSFILKYLDNIAKCFVSVLSIVVVAMVHVTTNGDLPRPNIVIGIVLTCMALEQYSLSQ